MTEYYQQKETKTDEEKIRNQITNEYIKLNRSYVLKEKGEIRQNIIELQKRLIEILTKKQNEVLEYIENKIKPA